MPSVGDPVAVLRTALSVSWSAVEGPLI